MKRQKSLGIFNLFGKEADVELIKVRTSLNSMVFEILIFTNVCQYLLNKQKSSSTQSPFM